MDASGHTLPSLRSESRSPAPDSSALGNLGSLISADSHCRRQLSSPLGGAASLFVWCGAALECDAVRPPFAAFARALALAVAGRALQQRHSLYLFRMGRAHHP